MKRINQIILVSILVLSVISCKQASGDDDEGGGTDESLMSYCDPEGIRLKNNAADAEILSLTSSPNTRISGTTGIIGEWNAVASNELIKKESIGFHLHEPDNHYSLCRIFTNHVVVPYESSIYTTWSGNGVLSSGNDGWYYFRKDWHAYDSYVKYFKFKVSSSYMYIVQYTP